MSRAVIILSSPESRVLAQDWIGRAPSGTRVEFKSAKRTIPQNARMWAMLTEVARQLTWHGNKLTTEDWKLVFMAALNKEMRIVPNIDGNGFVNLGVRSSALTKSEMSDMQELIAAFAARHGVALFDDETLDASAK